MERAEWKKHCDKVAVEMLNYVRPFVTPVSKVIEDNYGEHHGSASYIKINGDIYLITNEHVGRIITKNSLTHKFDNSDNLFRISNTITALEYPVDVAITKIEKEIWNACDHDSRPIDEACFAKKHNPVQAEIMFLIGYSGERSHFYFGNLATCGTPYTTQETDMPEEKGDPKYHFALFYNPDQAHSIAERSPGLPLPPGMSGSLVWNTRYVEFLQSGKKWSASDSKVTGLVWGWPSSNACLIATRIEFIDLKKLCSLVPNV
jgi:hypothetical protein